jgi:hypothetical protein
MMEEYGRLTLPNGRVRAPIIDDDFLIVRGITSNCSTTRKSKTSSTKNSEPPRPFSRAIDRSTSYARCSPMTD